MRYAPINNKLFTDNRKNFRAKIKSKSIAIFNSNDIQPTNADGTMPFRQNNDLFYLSGIDQEETILVLFPDVKDGKHKEILFTFETLYEIFNSNGNLVKKGFGKIISCSNLPKNNYQLSFDTSIENISL